MAEATDDRLRLLIERIERLEEEKKGIADDIRDVYAESKAVGYDTKIMRQIIRLRKMKPDERSEQETILDTYKAALGMGRHFAAAGCRNTAPFQAVGWVKGIHPWPTLSPSILPSLKKHLKNRGCRDRKPISIANPNGSRAIPDRED